MNSIIIALIISLAPDYNIPSKLAVAVAKVESSLKASAIGPVGEIGIFQVRPKYSKFPRLKLFRPEINIKEGLRMLAHAKKHCKHQEEMTWVICYNLGVKGGSRIKYPKKFRYYKRVMKQYGKLR